MKNRTIKEMKLTSIQISFLLLPLILLLLGQPSATVSKSIITKTCKSISKTDPNINNNVCISILTTAAAFHPHKDSHTMLTLTDLYFISVAAAVSEATSTRDHFRNLHKLSWNRIGEREDKYYVKGCFKVCEEVYSDAVDFFGISRKAVKKGQLEEAKTFMSGVLSVVTTCDDGFEDKGLVNPLKKNAKDMFEISVIALAILPLLWINKVNKYDQYIS